MSRMEQDQDLELELNAYLDGELDALAAREMEERIERDPKVKAAFEPLLALHQTLRTKLPIESAPEALRERILGVTGRPAAPLRFGGLRSIAASLVLGVMLGAGGIYGALNVAGRGEAVAERVVENHIRAGLAAEPIDIASSDRHTVKPWFMARLTTAPPVVDLAKEGCALIGGRVDVVERQALPTLVYRKREHLISVTAFPSAPARPEATFAGYNIASWSGTGSGLSYIAVTDMPRAELDQFVEAFKVASAETTRE